jgi:hypothetical protein
MFASLEEAASMRGSVEVFEPAMTEAVRAARLVNWNRAREQVLSL